MSDVAGTTDVRLYVLVSDAGRTGEQGKRLGRIVAEGVARTIMAWAHNGPFATPDPSTPDAGPIPAPLTVGVVLPGSHGGSGGPGEVFSFPVVIDAAAEAVAEAVAGLIHSMSLDAIDMRGCTMELRV